MNKEVAAYAPVDVAEVRESDEVKVDGIGYSADTSYAGREAFGTEFNPVIRTQRLNILIKRSDGEIWFRRSSIVSARRRVEPKPETKECRFPCTHAVCPDCEGKTSKCCWCGKEIAPPAPPKQEAEPEVKPGTWKHLPSTGYTSDAFAHNCLAWKCQVRRSDGRDHADERRGERRKGAQWVVKVGSKVKAFGWGCALRTYDDANLFAGEELLVTSLRGSNPSDISVVGPGGEYDIHIRNLDLVDRRKSDRRRSK
jgi:hypothetical protein